nr:aminoglycoside 6-adenylyltransferase [Anaerotignum lactatifermentans]
MAGCVGEVILKQEQDDDFGYGERFGIRGDYDKSYSWLLLFADGNRIDIGVETLETMEQGKNRNRWMVQQTDFVIAYVIRGEGGAYTAVEYARKKGKKVCLI